MVHLICYYSPNPRPPNLWHFEYPGEVSDNSSFMEVKQKIHEEGGPLAHDQRFLMHCDVKFRNVYTGGREKITVRVVLKDYETLQTNVFTNKAMASRQRYIQIHVIDFNSRVGQDAIILPDSGQRVDLAILKANFRNDDVVYGPTERHGYHELLLQLS
jgi:hypothetical protein